ncbi:MAG: flavodoxin domain-containing protein, partial [Anaerolineae bacterium]
IDLSLYSAVIMGSSVYVGRWRPEAIKFLKEKEDILKEKDFWVFSSGPTGSGDPSDILDGWSLPRTQETIINRIGARSIKLFHGKIDPSKLDMLELFTVKTIHAETGDHRDWEAIGAWATSIAEAYQENV